MYTGGNMFDTLCQVALLYHMYVNPSLVTCSIIGVKQLSLSSPSNLCIAWQYKTSHGSSHLFFQSINNYIVSAHNLCTETSVQPINNKCNTSIT